MSNKDMIEDAKFLVRAVIALIPALTLLTGVMTAIMVLPLWLFL